MKNNNIKIMSVNKGNSEINTKIDQLNNMIQVHNPDIFAINEINIKLSDTVTKNQFPGYTLEVDSLGKTNDRARTGVLIKNTITYKRRKDLEQHGSAIVWLQIKSKEKKQFLIQCIYRQFTKIGEPGSTFYNSAKSQMEKNY